MKTSIWRRSQLNQYCSYKPHSIFKPTWIFWRFCMYPSNETFDKNFKKSVLGLNSKDRKSTMYKANISNPKVHIGCAPHTANRISAGCVQISLGSSIPYIPLGVYHTRGFYAMLSLLVRQYRSNNTASSNRLHCHNCLSELVNDCMLQLLFTHWLAKYQETYGALLDSDNVFSSCYPLP